MAMVMDLMDILIGLKCKTFVRRDGDGDGSDGYCYRIETVLHVIDVIATVMDIALVLNL